MKKSLSSFGNPWQDVEFGCNPLHPPSSTPLHITVIYVITARKKNHWCPALISRDRRKQPNKKRQEQKGRQKDGLDLVWFFTERIPPLSTSPLLSRRCCSEVPMLHVLGPGSLGTATSLWKTKRRRDCVLQIRNSLLLFPCFRVCAYVRAWVRA